MNTFLIGAVAIWLKFIEFTGKSEELECMSLTFDFLQKAFAQN